MIANDDPAILPIDKTISCQINSWDGFDLSTCYDALKGELIFKAQIPNNSWLGIGFGATMKNTDMITWSAKNGIGRIYDSYSSGYGKPKEDKVQNVELASNPSFNKSEDRVSFVVRRKLDTGDSDNDFIVILDEDIAMSYAYKQGSGNIG